MVVESGPGHSHRDISLLQGPSRRLGERIADADVDESKLACQGLARGDEVTGLCGSEGHAEVCIKGCTEHLARVGIDPAGQVDRHPDPLGRIEDRDHLRSSAPQGSRRPDADESVDDDVGLVHERLRAITPPHGETAPRAPELGEAGDVDAIGRADRIDPHATTSESRAGEEGVTTVIARACGNDHAGARDGTGEQAQDLRGQPGGGPVHENPGIEFGRVGMLRGDDIGNAVGIDHLATPSATT
ncbi:unannotated protein [freshwater metagenome]|uniref:Unannotated protein n=1 Tax=freshwater metagenome TaxID=449393 RepID=A0A6J6SY56_9ZZZZ